MVDEGCDGSLSGAAWAGKTGCREKALEHHETELCSPSHLCVPKRQIYCARRGAEKIGARSSPCSTRRRLAIIAPQSLFRASNCPLWDLYQIPLIRTRGPIGAVRWT